MYSVPHLISTKGDNKGSCRKYAEYLLKENTMFFSHSSNEISLEEGITFIDENSKFCLGKNDAKWYAPVYALSEEEAQFVAYKITGRMVENFSDLSPKEQKEYNEYIVDLARSFQGEMARNFNKEDLGIKGGENLFYIGVVENKRKYIGTDDEVKLGLKKNGEEKKGFNTHIHIIQSRLANNGKKSKISPMASERKSRVNNLGGKVGFDRNIFANRIEQYFDILTGYVRLIKETFEYRKAKKKGKDLSEFHKIQQINPFIEVEEEKEEEELQKNPIEEKGEKQETTENTSEEKKEYKFSFQQEKTFRRRARNELSKEEKKQDADGIGILLKEKRILLKEKPVIKRKYIPKSEADRIIGNAKILDYFLYLEKVGLLERQYEKGRDIYYRNLKGELIAVSERGYRNYTRKTGGQIMNAIREMQQVSWSEALAKLIELNDEQVIVPEAKIKKEYKLLKTEDSQKSYLKKPYEELGISDFYAEEYLTSVKFESNGKEITALGMKTRRGGYYVYNPKFNTFNKVGGGGISIVEARVKTESDYERSRNIVIFPNYVEYLAYLQKYKGRGMKETVFILNDRENTKELLWYIKARSRYTDKVYSFLDDNYVLDKLSENNVEVEDMRASHRIEKSSFLERLTAEKEDIVETPEETIRKMKRRL